MAISAGFVTSKAGRSNYVAHSGLIVHPDYRNLGLAKKIKSKVFDYSLKKYPNAKYLDYNWFRSNENQLRTWIQTSTVFRTNN
jgi:GNAT superfamily N-acetyltransferase